MFTQRWFKLFVVIAMLIGSMFLVSTASATPGSGLMVEKLADGNLEESVHVKIKGAFGKSDMDVTEAQTYRVTFAPGAFSGWHQHGGPHIIMVVSGTLTYFHGDDPTCTPEYYPAGSAIFDPGFTTHYARNDGAVNVVVYITQLLPENGTFRIDVPAPGNCPF